MPSARRPPKEARAIDDTIRYELTDGVATITLNRPDTLNAFNDEMLGGLGASLKAAGRDPDARCIVITGAGRAFSAGQDLAAVRARGEAEGGGMSFREHLEKTYNRIIHSIRTLEKPVIGAVNGVAAGAGASVALACDMRVASDKASFVMAFAGVGLVPDSGSTWFLPRALGFARAYELYATGGRLSAAEALEHGLVNKVVPLEDFEAATSELASAMAAAPTKALGLTKRAMNRAMGTSLDEALAYEAMLQEIAGGTDDHKEGIAAVSGEASASFCRSMTSHIAGDRIAVGVVGSGTMGAGIAQVAAVAGHSTVLFDLAPDLVSAARDRIGGFLHRAAEKGRMTEDDSAAALARISASTDLKDMADCGLIIEAAPERIDLKRELFSDLEAIVDTHAILATNTSTLSVGAIAGGLEHRGRLCGMHFFNPAPLMALVEVIRGPESDPLIVSEVMRLASAWGKVPRRSERHAPGLS